MGILHEPTGQIFLASFDQVPAGHAGLVARVKLPQVECKGFVVARRPDGTYAVFNLSHLNGPQGQPGSLQMPQPTFQAIVQALHNGGL